MTEPQGKPFTVTAGLPTVVVAELEGNYVEARQWGLQSVDLAREWLRRGESPAVLVSLLAEYLDDQRLRPSRLRALSAILMVEFAKLLEHLEARFADELREYFGGDDNNVQSGRGPG